MACYSPEGIPKENDPEQIKINKIFVDKDNRINDLKKKKINILKLDYVQ